MHVSGIGNGGGFQLNAQMQSRVQQFQDEFQQLGEDLQTGSLATAQSDFATLQQNAPKLGTKSQANPSSTASGASAASQSTNPILRAFNALASDLQSGNIAAAKQDYATLEQELPGAASHRLQRAGHWQTEAPSGQSQQGGVLQTLQSLAQQLQTGNFSAAQNAYGALQADLQEFAQANGLMTTGASGSSSTSTPAVAGSLSVSA